MICSKGGGRETESSRLPCDSDSLQTPDGSSGFCAFIELNVRGSDASKGDIPHPSYRQMPQCHPRQTYPLKKKKKANS